MDWLDKLTNWFKQLFTDLWKDLVDFFTDYLVAGAKAALDLVVVIVNAIPIPDFLDGINICSMLGNAGPWASWAISTFHIAEGMTLIAGAVVFRLLRKVLTLFQW